MVVYFLIVRDLKGELQYFCEVKESSFRAVIVSIGLLLNSRKFKEYERQGYPISTHEKQQVIKSQAGAAYREQCFLNLCVFFGFTDTEEMYMRLLLLKIARIDMPPILYRHYGIVVTSEAIDFHCRNIQKKTGANSDAGSVSRF
jgi:hypothetical protein